MSDPRTIAAWRYERIAPLLDRSLSRAERRRHLRALTKQPIEWPLTDAEEARGEGPKIKPVSRSSVNTWLADYKASGFVGLIPAVRSDRGTSRHDVDAQVDYALALLYENPERSFTQLLAYIDIEFSGRGVTDEVHIISRSTLSRRLREHAAYTGILKERGEVRDKQRGSFQADRAHECWQLDGKGPFTVQFTDGTELPCCILSIIDCYSRAVLAATVCLSENTAGTILVFIQAARKYGLAERFQFDKGSAFNSIAFRSAIADLGVHRNFTATQTPEFQGLVEAYHRVLIRWFIKELPYEEVHDLEHLQELLTAMIELLYNGLHYHRVIKSTPAAKLAGRISERRLDEETLVRSFWIEEQGSIHPKTGEVHLSMGRYRVPASYARGRRVFRCYPVPDQRVTLVTPDGREIDLEPFEVKPLPPPRYERRTATGQLQRLLDTYRGETRAQSEPGFGLPEVFREFARLLGRSVPESTAEAKAISAFWREYGPLPRTPFSDALARASKALGPGRPVQSYLDHLARLVRAADDTTDTQEPKEA